jgi:hypothetical protein
MTCEHLRQLYQLCQDHDLRISSSDVIRFKCKECEQIEVCPSMLTDEYEARASGQQEPAPKPNP